MALQSLLQILKVNDPRSGTTKEGRAWEMQEAECVILTDDGEIAEVGVLSIPQDLRSVVKPGIFMGTFALRSSKRREGGRRIEPVIVGLQPYDVKGGAPVRVASMPKGQ